MDVVLVVLNFAGGTRPSGSREPMSTSRSDRKRRINEANRIGRTEPSRASR